MNTASFIGGRYRVEGRIGVGGMSTVMLAVDERLEREVAVKLLAEHLADDPTFVSRFRREALAAARLVHPNIVQVFDSGFDQAAHQHFIVMEYVRGLSCAEILRERGHLDVDQAVDIVEQACRGLDYAHRNGVVHRDVKPGNLLVSESNVVKLADFGIARATGQTSITQVGSVLGTAAYLSPEQARGQEAGPQADLYSLGVVTYQLLSGRLPYEATSLSELALKQQREAPIPLQRLNPRVPAALAEAVALAISVVAEERPHTAVELAQLIEDGANGISPYDSEGPTRHMGASDAATRVMRGGDYSTQETAITRPVAPRPVAPRTGQARTPRTVPSRQTAPREPTSRRPQAQAPEPRAPRRRRRGARRVAMAITMLLVLAVVAIVIGVAVHQTASTVKYEKVVANDAQRALDKVQTIISNNTK
jgi:eukaryotic-like serine/threonine-protein kinase